MTSRLRVRRGLDPHLETRSLDLKGKAAGTDVVSLTVSPQAAAVS